MFRYRQIPDTTDAEADFPNCWNDQVYHLGCAEVSGHFHYLAARGREKQFPPLRIRYKIEVVAFVLKCEGESRDWLYI